MAAESAVTVKNERDIASGALPGVAAGAAGEVGGPASPVDQQDRLATAACDLCECVAGPWMEGAPHSASHVHDLDGRQRPAIDPREEFQPVQLLPALGAGRRGAAEQ